MMAIINSKYQIVNILNRVNSKYKVWMSPFISGRILDNV